MSDKGYNLDPGILEDHKWLIAESNYQVMPDRLLGRGKFGEVYVGDWMGTPVAVKRVYDFDVKENIDLFQAEIKLMKDLHHPYIVQFLGFSHHQSLKTLSLVMEYLPGGSLEDYVSTHWNVPLHLRQRWSGQMAQALAYLHNRKPGFLIHRDLKPSNFMLSHSLQCKLGDFGISRLFVNKVAGPDDSAGFAYSPEHTRGDSLDRSREMDSIRDRSAHGRGGYFLNVTSRGLDSTVNGPPMGLEQTSNCGTARYMAPEVHKFTSDDTIETTRASYGVQVDIFSVGMVYYFVFESKPPSLPGGINPDKHFELLAQGVRPAYERTPHEHRRIIDLCLRASPLERPTAKELVVLLRGSDGLKTHKPSVFSCLLGQKPPSLQAADDAQAAREVYERASKRSSAGRQGSKSNLSYAMKPSRPGSPESKMQAS